MLFHLVKIYSVLKLIFMVYQRIQVAYYIVARLMDVLVSYHLQDFYPLVFVTIKKYVKINQIKNEKNELTNFLP